MTSQAHPRGAQSRATPQTPYDMLGAEGVRALCHAFYRIMDTSDRTREIRALHGEDLSGIEDRLTDYLTTWLGGPRIWIEKHGGMCLTRVHDHYRIGPQLRDQWLYCMEQALEEIKAPEDLKNLLRQPFYGIADMVMNVEED